MVELIHWKIVNELHLQISVIGFGRSQPDRALADTGEP